MAGNHYTLPELAKLAGLSETTCRRYAREFSDFLPSEHRGRTRIYRPECVSVLQRIRELYGQGHDTEAVQDQLAQEYDRTIEVDHGADSGGQPPASQGPDARDIAQEMVSAIKRNAQTEQDVHRLKQVVKALRDQVVKIRNERKALPDPRTMDQVLARLNRLEKDVQALKDERSKSWWRKLTGKKDGS